MIYITDTGGSTITCKYEGYDSSNTLRKSHTLTIPATPVGGSGGGAGGGTGSANYNGWTPNTRTTPGLLLFRPTPQTVGVFDPAVRAALTVHQGNLTVTQANATIRRLRVTGETIVSASGLMFEECQLVGRISRHSSRPTRAPGLGSDAAAGSGSSRRRTV